MTGRGTLHVSEKLSCNCCAPLSAREAAVKFNDYFEFPRELDMSSYTAAHLAKTEGMHTHTRVLLWEKGYYTFTQKFGN